jgi:phage protein D
VPVAKYRLYVDNEPASVDQLAVVTSIKVEQAIGMAAAAEFTVNLATDDTGAWKGFDDAFAKPFARLRVEVKLDDGDYVALIDGPVVGERFELDAAPDASRLVIVVHDDSVLLDREEKVVVFKNKALDGLVGDLIEEPGLSSRISAQLPDAGSALDRWIVQRGTNMQLLRQLARRFGMFVYVEPGATPGKSVGVFEAPEAHDDSLPDLLLLGEERNIGTFSAEFDALRPLAPKAGAVQAIDKKQISGSADSADEPALGEEAAHTLVTPPVTLLAHTREEQSDVDAATAGVANMSAWAYSARGEVDNDLYPAVLRPYRKLHVRGVGPQLSGDYMVARVRHQIDDGGYRQRFSLSRNARSADSSASALSTLGAALAQIF